MPLAVLVALLAGPIVAACCRRRPARRSSTPAPGMLRVFAPQLPLYGIGIVLTGVLQAHRRFAWPVLAPLLSSLTVIGAYLAFAAVDGPGADLAEVEPGRRAGPVGRHHPRRGGARRCACWSRCAGCGLRLRPALRVRRRRRGAGSVRLALAGAVTVAAQQLALLVVLWRGLRRAERRCGALQPGADLYLLPWAVLAVPLATAAYPTLAAAAATGRRGRRTGAPWPRPPRRCCC